VDVLPQQLDGFFRRDQGLRGIVQAFRQSSLHVLVFFHRKHFDGCLPYRNIRILHNGAQGSQEVWALRQEERRDKRQYLQGFQSG
jgi:hypothetical protein